MFKTPKSSKPQKNITVNARLVADFEKTKLTIIERQLSTALYKLTMQKNETYMLKVGCKWFLAKIPEIVQKIKMTSIKKLEVRKNESSCPKK